MNSTNSVSRVIDLSYHDAVYMADLLAKCDAGRVQANSLNHLQVTTLTHWAPHLRSSAQVLSQRRTVKRPVKYGTWNSSTGNFRAARRKCATRLRRHWPTIISSNAPLAVGRASALLAEAVQDHDMLGYSDKSAFNIAVDNLGHNQTRSPNVHKIVTILQRALARAELAAPAAAQGAYIPVGATFDVFQVSWESVEPSQERCVHRGRLHGHQCSY